MLAVPSGAWRQAPARLGQTQTFQETLDEFYEKWQAANTNSGRAAVEQQYLPRFDALAEGYRTALASAFAEKPRQAGKIATIRDKAILSGACFDYLFENAAVPPVERRPYSPSVGKDWVTAANAVSSKLRQVETDAQADLDRMAKEFGSLPPTPTPRVCPTRPPKPGEEAAPSGEPGSRPRIPILDDVLDLVRWLGEHWWLLLVPLGAYIGYKVFFDGADGKPVLACLRKNGRYDLLDPETLVKVDGGIAPDELTKSMTVLRKNDRRCKRR